MAKLEPKSCAAEIVAGVGGPENVNSVTHCMTRARFVLKDAAKANIEDIKKINGVLGCIYSAGQLQVILGANLLLVYDEIIKQNNFKEDAVVDEKEDDTDKKGNFFQNALAYVQASVTPMIPALIAGGMMKVLLLVIDMIWKDFSATSTYTILGYVGNAPFYFMPVLVAMGAARKLKCTEGYSVMVVAALLTPGWVEMVGAGDVTASVFGIPARLITYNGQLLPALLIPIAACYAEKFFNKIVPGIFKSIFVGLGTVTVAGALGFTVLGPLGRYLGDFISNVFLFLGDNVPFIAVAALAACLPWMIMAGMHTALSPFMAQNIENIGYDAVIRPAFVLHNVAEGGAVLGVGFRSKDKEFRTECISLAIGAIVAGVTEPAIYGVNLKYKKPMFAVMIGAAAGGVVAALLGAKVFVMGYSNVMAILPMCLETAGAMFIGVGIAIVVAAIIAFILVKPEELE